MSRILLERAEAGDIRAAEALLRLHREERLQRKMSGREALPRPHRAADELWRARMADPAEVAADAELHAQMDRMLAGMSPSTPNGGEAP